MTRPDAQSTEPKRSSTRWRHRGSMTEWVAAHTNDEVMAALGGSVPVGVVNKPGDLFTDDHVASRQMLVAVDQPAGRPIVQVNTPMKFTATPTGVYRRAPIKGEHDDEIRREIEPG